jgi:hypothetical protein
VCEDVPWTEARLVVADVESNGRRPPRLVEAAVVAIVAGGIGEPVTWLVRPPEPTTWQASQVHRITNVEVAEPTVPEPSSTQLVTGICSASSSPNLTRWGEQVYRPPRRLRVRS